MSEFSDHQIIGNLKGEAETRCHLREHQISETTYHQWKSKYGSMEAADVGGLPELEVRRSSLKNRYMRIVSLENVRRSE